MLVELKIIQEVCEHLQTLEAAPQNYEEYRQA